MKFNKYLVALAFLVAGSANSQIVDIKGPLGSERFGSTASILSNGNLVFIDYLYDDGAKKDVGAVHLYNGKSLELIGTLKGSTEGDSVGFNGIQFLVNGNFVVKSQYWQNGALDNVGAVTFVNGITGLNAVVSVSNSVIGASKDEYLGSNFIYAFNNGNYAVVSVSFDNGSAKDAGAVAYCNGTNGSAFTMGVGNSLVGGSENDRIGSNGIVTLSNGNFLVLSPDWDNGTDSNAGAVTFCPGNSGMVGKVTEFNSLIGNHKNDLLGASTVYYYGNYGVITEVGNGNYLVFAPFWHYDTASNAGSATWCNGTTGRVGKITKDNSLVGSHSGDRLGRLNSFGDIGIFQVLGGNYIVCSPECNNGKIKKAGAVTWGSGSAGVIGEISASNSLVGGHDSDLIGVNYPTFLSNGNLVICSPYWDLNSIPDVGAATWFNTTTGTFGVVGESNSVIGSSAYDYVGVLGCRALNNSNYLVLSYLWNNDTMVQAGAVTWCFGGAPTALTVNKGNSLVGSHKYDNVGQASTQLTNSNYVIGSSQWDNGAKTNAGACTWGNGTTGVAGEINSSNSVVGQTMNDAVGASIRALNNGNYVLLTSSWDSGSILNVGAATWCDGATGRTGFISPDNSLVGSSASDGLSMNITTLTNGNYLISNRNWDNGAAVNAGAVTWCNGATGRTGVISKFTSIVGASSNDNLGNSISGHSSGKYVIRCSACDNAGIIDAGAFVIANSDGTTVGEVSTANALMGGTAMDNVGSNFTTLSNGNILLRSSAWDNGANANAGAITWMDINNPATGLVSAANSLVGTHASETLGNDGVSGFNGDYVFRSRNWSSAPNMFEGAVTWANGSTGLTGSINSCNSFLGKKPNTGNQLSLQFSGLNKYALILRPMDTMASVYWQNGQSLAVHLDAISLAVSGNTAAALITASCRIIALVTPNGNQPLAGKVKGEVWVETAQPDSFVKRHYQITAAGNTDSADAKVTLFFTQAEFDDYNASHTAKLPASDNDHAGKLNLRIEKRGGVSSDKTGLPNTYPGATTILNPEETDVVWNEGLKRWEVSFNSTGFSGFFVKAQATVNAIEDKEKDQYQNSISIFPNPTDGEVYILVSNKANTELEVTNMLGKTVFKKSIKGNGNYKIDLTAHMPGIYLIKFNTGEVYKVIKN